MLKCWRRSEIEPPHEVINGIIPVKNNYQQDMIKARKNRLNKTDQ